MTFKTSVYLDGEQAERLKRAAADSGRTMADLIREGIDLVVLRNQPVRRTRPWPTFDSGDPEFASLSAAAFVLPIQDDPTPRTERWDE